MCLRVSRIAQDDNSDLRCASERVYARPCVHGRLVTFGLKRCPHVGDPVRNFRCAMGARRGRARSFGRSKVMGALGGWRRVRRRVLHKYA